MTKSVGKKQQPGTRLITVGIVALVLGFVLLIINLTNPVTNYVAGVGMVTTKGPSTGAIVLLVAGLVVAGIGFARRLLAAIEKN